jgi:hypothetical protein
VESDESEEYDVSFFLEQFFAITTFFRVNQWSSEKTVGSWLSLANVPQATN